MRLQQRGRMHDSKEEEIAKLEEQLKKLKEDGSTSETPRAYEGGTEVVVEEPAEEEISIDLFLSEQWKEEEKAAAESSEGGGFVGIIAAVGLALFLVGFSQVPVGQEDLSKYSAIKAPTQTIDFGDLNRVRKSGDL
jgi:hypothetical protein